MIRGQTRILTAVLLLLALFPVVASAGHRDVGAEPMDILRLIHRYAGSGDLDKIPRLLDILDPISRNIAMEEMINPASALRIAVANGDQEEARRAVVEYVLADSRDLIRLAVASKAEGDGVAIMLFKRAAYDFQLVEADLQAMDARRARMIKGSFRQAVVATQVRRDGTNDNVDWTEFPLLCRTLLGALKGDL